MRPTSMALSALTLAFTTFFGALNTKAFAATKAISPEAVQRTVREALDLKSKNRLIAAESRLRKVLKAAPDNVDVRSVLGWVLISRKHTAAAVRQFRSVIRLAPDSSAGREAKAALYRLASRDGEQPSTLIASREKSPDRHSSRPAAQASAAPVTAGLQSPTPPDTASMELVQLRVQHQQTLKELAEARRAAEQLSTELQSYREQLRTLQTANMQLREQNDRATASVKPEAGPTGEQAAAERARFEEMAALGRRSGALVPLATALQQLATDAEETGNSTRAVALYQEAISVQQRLGDGLGGSWSLAHLGKLVAAQGNPEQGEQFLREALTSFTRTGTGWGVAWALQALGAVAEGRGDKDRATRLSGAAQQLRGTLLGGQPGGDEANAGSGDVAMGASGSPVDGPASGSTPAPRQNSGSALPLEQAIAYALRR